MSLKITNPATRQVVAELPEDNADSIAAKVARARAAQPAWARTPLDAPPGRHPRLPRSAGASARTSWR